MTNTIKSFEALTVADVAWIRDAKLIAIDWDAINKADGANGTLTFSVFKYGFHIANSENPKLHGKRVNGGMGASRPAIEAPEWAIRAPTPEDREKWQRETLESEREEREINAAEEARRYAHMAALAKFEAGYALTAEDRGTIGTYLDQLEEEAAEAYTPRDYQPLIENLLDLARKLVR
jgi:hypothetical protein